MRTTMLILALGLAACSAGTSPATPPAAEPTTPAAQPSAAEPTPEDRVPALDLRARIPPTGLEHGWEVSSCDPNQTILENRSLFIIVVEGLGPRTCIPTEGTALTPDQLEAFRPTLDQLVANLRPPEVAET